MKSSFHYQPAAKIDGRYLVRQRLKGGMGEVYLCRDLETNLPYALKTFQQRYLANLKIRELFKREVATWVALEKHPNVVRCFHMDILDNQPFMILEWIASDEDQGPDLRSWLKRDPLDLRLALEFTIDICRGLIHAQEKQPGMVHRDLKPDNILVAQGSVAKITDFGLAQIVQEAELDITSEIDEESAGRQNLVSQDGVVGTPHYMAPEQWRGERLDARTDIYAVGCILYELLTGAPPFQVDFIPSPAQIKQWRAAMQAKHEQDVPASLPPTLPKKVDDIVQACLAKERPERPESVAELLRLVEHAYRQEFTELPKVEGDLSEFTAVDYNNRALTYAALQQYEAALADYNRAIELNPTFAKAYVNRGATFSHLQQYETALADYSRAIELEPSDAKIYLNRGTTYASLQQYESALADYEQAIALEPGDASAYYNRGVIYAGLKQYEGALADYNQAVELQPNFAKAYYNRGIVNNELRKYQVALTDFSRAVELDPGNARAFLNRGITYAKLQQYNAALADYNRAIELEPNNAQTYYNRGVTYADRQQHQEALADYNRAIELEPNDAKIYYNRGAAYDNLQQYETGLADYSRAIELDPNNARAYLNRGVTYADLRQYEAALADYQRAIELDPNYAEAYVNRGNVYFHLQQGDAALADYNRAIKLEPNFALAYFNIGMLLANQGQSSEALTHLEKAAQLGHPSAAQYAAHIRQRLTTG